jgi:ankyrin repeat protein
MVRWASQVALGIALAVAVAAASAQIRYGRMSVDEAFPDQRVARMVEAASRGDVGAVDAEIQAGADVNYVGTDGISPLLWVMVEARRRGDLKGLERLLKAGANPNYRDEKRKASAMALAAGGDRPRILELLLKYKGDPDLIGPAGEPLLHIAAGEFRRENIDLLLQYGADINIHEGNGSTAAHVAARLGRFDLVAYLLEKGLTYNIQGLARSVEISHVRPNSEAQRWKDKVIEMLKERGAKFPAFVPPKPRSN